MGVSRGRNVSPQTRTVRVHGAAGYRDGSSVSNLAQRLGQTETSPNVMALPHPVSFEGISGHIADAAKTTFMT